MTMRRQTFSGVRWTTFSSFGRAFLQVAQISILARLLTPSDFGLIALVTSFMAFLQIFADAGISNAIIHNQNISQEQLSSLYWLNVGVSVLLALMLVMCAPLVASWYQHPQMKLLLVVAGGTLVVGALAQQIRVVAQKNLRFAPLSKIELTSACVGFIVAVLAALYRLGVYSIAIGNFTAAILSTVLIWWFLADGWRPLFRIHLTEIRHFLNFGAYMIGNNLANTFNSQLDIILGGKLLGSQSIGLYSVPRDLNLRIAGIINPVVTNVGLPVMARAQNDKLLLKQIYLKTMRMTASVNFPIYIAIALFAPEIVFLFLGRRWEAAIPLLRIFAIWALFRSTTNPVGSLLFSCGRADISFKWNMALLFILPPFLWLGSQQGITGIAMSMALLMILLFWPNWYFQVRPLCKVKFVEYLIECLIPLILALVAGVVALFVSKFVVVGIVRLLLGLFVGVFLYAVLCWRFNKAWFSLISELVFYKKR